MQITMKRLGILTLAICLLAALMFGGYSVAQAASWWPPDHSSDHTNSLTVYATGDEDMQKDLAAAEAYVILFKVADATPENDYEAFTYTYTDAFGGRPLTPPTVDDPKAKEIWQEKARDAAKLVDEQSISETAGRGDLTEEYGYKAEMDLTDGIYLAVMYSKNNDSWHWNDDYSTTIKGARNEYTFNPQLIALPSKDPVEGQIASSNPGSWVSNPIIYLKPELKDRYGSLVIKKKVKNSGGYAIKPVSFVFHVTGTLPDGKTPYGPNGEGNYVTVQYSGGESVTATLEHIQAGTELTVTELPLSEASWGLDSLNDQKVTILGDGKTEVSTVEFTNEYKPAKGFAVDNKFELQKIGDGDDDWDWVWTQVTPESVKTEPTG